MMLTDNDADRLQDLEGWARVEGNGEVLWAVRRVLSSEWAAREMAEIAERFQREARSREAFGRRMAGYVRRLTSQLAKSRALVDLYRVQAGEEHMKRLAVEREARELIRQVYALCVTYPDPGQGHPWRQDRMKLYDVAARAEWEIGKVTR